MFPLALVACGGSMSYYGKHHPAGTDVSPVDSGDDDDDTDPTTPTDTTTTTDSTPTTDTTTTTTTTDTTPACDRPRDCEDPRCDSVCDSDGDGEITEDLGGRDCDDTDDTIHPGAPDVCDRVDNDCDGVRDDDGDRDGYDVCDDCDDTDRQVHPGHADACDGADADCDGEDCAPWDEDFEGGGLGANWMKSGQGNWHLDTTWSHRGLQAAMSGATGDGQQAVMEITFDLSSAGSVSFWHRGDTESGYDKLHFQIDGVQRDVWSGNWGWTQASYPVSAGVHTFMFQYTKDGSVSVGRDEVGIDDMTVENGRPL